MFTCSKPQFSYHLPLILGGARDSDSDGSGLINDGKEDENGKGAGNRKRRVRKFKDEVVSK